MWCGLTNWSDFPRSPLGSVYYSLAQLHPHVPPWVPQCEACEPFPASTPSEDVSRASDTVSLLCCLIWWSTVEGFLCRCPSLRGVHTLSVSTDLRAGLLRPSSPLLAVPCSQSPPPCPQPPVALRRHRLCYRSFTLPRYHSESQRSGQVFSSVALCYSA